MKFEEEIKSNVFTSEQVKATLNILFTASWLHAKISSQLKPFGISQEQFNVLRILKGQHPNPVAQKDILHRMLDRSSNLTRILAKLNGKELVTIARSIADKREYEIQVTPKAILLLDAIATEFSKKTTNVTGLSVSEAFHLNSLLDRLREAE